MGASDARRPDKGREGEWQAGGGEEGGGGDARVLAPLLACCLVKEGSLSRMKAITEDSPTQHHSPSSTFRRRRRRRRRCRQRRTGWKKSHHLLVHILLAFLGSLLHVSSLANLILCRRANPIECGMKRRPYSPSSRWYLVLISGSAWYLILCRMVFCTDSLFWNRISGLPWMTVRRRPERVRTGAPYPGRPKAKASCEEKRRKNEATERPGLECDLEFSMLGRAFFAVKASAGVHHHSYATLNASLPKTDEGLVAAVSKGLPLRLEGQSRSRRRRCR